MSGEAAIVGNGANRSSAGVLRAGPTLLVLMSVVVALNAWTWLSGMKGYALAVAVEEGTARAETAGIGELGDDVVRKAIRTQEKTTLFWGVLSALGDFLGEPAALALRALAVAVVFSSLAALTGRPVGFHEAFAECAAAQSFWVLDLALRSALMVALRRPDVETSATLLLPTGAYGAPLWAALSQISPFAAIGWLVMALGGRRRGQVNLATAFLVCGALWFGEAAVRIAFTLTLGAGMRLSLMPDRPMS